MQKVYSKVLLFVLLVLVSFYVKGQTASFSIDHRVGCPTLFVSFHNTTGGDTTGFKWDLGNGTIISQTDASTSYTTPGTYIVRLVAFFGTTDSSVTTDTVFVVAPPTVSFTTPDPTVCLGTPAILTSTSSSGVYTPLTCKWNLGNGDTLTGPSVSYAYSSLGYYNVTLAVTNSVGCRSSLTIDSFFRILPLPSITFTTPTTVFCTPPACISFTDTITNGTAPYIHKWYFGDGDSSSAHNPIHVYNTYGYKTVQLRATDQNGCSSTFTRSNYIFGDSNNYARINTADSTLCPNETTSLYDHFYSFGTTTWLFDSVATITYSDYYTRTVKYTTPGIKGVRLIKTDGYGCRDTARINILVYTPPVINFSITPAFPCPQPSLINIAATATSDTAIPHSSINWSLGDGTFDTGYSVSHTYITLDTFYLGHSTYKVPKITMSATDIHSCTSTLIKYDTIYTMLYEVHASPLQGCDSLTCTLSTLLQTDVPFLSAPAPFPRAVAHREWDFGDGGYSTLPTPVHTYHGVGNYYAKCRSTTIDSCVVIDSVRIRVGRADSAYYTASFDTSFIPGHMCYGTEVHFHGYHTDTASYGQTIRYVWDYDEDGVPDTTSIPYTSHIFIAPGTYHVSVMAIVNGCAGEWSEADSFIVDPPMIRMAITYNCDSPMSVSFSSDSTVGATSLLWQFGDGDTSVDSNPIHLYPHTSLAAYELLVTAYNSISHCTDTVASTVTTIDMTSRFTANDTSICRDEKVYFTAHDSAVSQYRWYVNDVLRATRTSIDTFSYVFHNLGYDTVKLVIKDQHDCLDSVSHLIYASKPVAHAYASSYFGCTPMTVTYVDTSTPTPGSTISSYLWQYEGTLPFTSTTNDSTSYTYVVSDPWFRSWYDPVEIVIDNNGCRDTFHLNRVVNENVTAQIYRHGDSVFCVGANAYLQNLSSGGIYDGYMYHWYFGDGGEATTVDGNHIYADTGTYYVKLVVSNIHFSCTDSTTRKIRITKPVASFYMADSFSVCHPVDMTFFNTSVGAVSYTWQSGNGSESHFANPVFHYLSGVYNVTLYATDSYGCSDTATNPLTVFGFTGDFAYPDSGCGPLSVNFHLHISDADTIKWDFQDGNTVIGTIADTNVIHAYGPGTHIPILQIKKGGCESTSIGADTIKVDAVTADYTSPGFACPFTPVNFVDNSTSLFSSIIFSYWTLPPADTGLSVTHIYGSSGTYPIRHITVDGWQCRDTVTGSVTIYPHECTVSSDAGICINDSTTLTASGGSSYNWYPATGLSCPACAITKASPLVSTTYHVSALNTHGCYDTLSVTVTVRANPLVTVVPETDTICPGFSVVLTASGASTYSWTPSATLSSAVGGTVTASPLTATTYIVTGVDSLGCFGSDTALISLYTSPTVGVSALPATGICYGASTVLTATGATTYSWSPSGTLSSAVGNPVTATPGTTTAYTVIGTDIHGCKDTNSINMLVYEHPAISNLGYTGTGCVGASVGLYDTTAGGTPGYTFSWTGPSGYTSAIQNPVLTSVTTGMAGWYKLTVTDTHGCSAIDSVYVNIYTPTAFSISGDTSLCYGDSTVLTASPSSGMSFSWSPTGTLTCPTCASTSVHLSATTTYNVIATDVHECISSAVTTVNVHSFPVVSAITGDTVLCVNDTATLHCATEDGVWTSGDYLIAAIEDPMGIVTGVAAGTTHITYTVTSEYGCATFVTTTVRVDSLPVISITGPDSVCAGLTDTLSSGLSGGTWSASPSSVVLISPTGVVTGVAGGLGTIVYSISNGFGCSAIDSMSFRVDTIPVVPPLTSKPIVCLHDTTSIEGDVSGGFWGSLDTSIATAGTTWLGSYIYGVDTGIGILTYTVISIHGCAGFATDTCIVLPLPYVAPLSGHDSVCLGGTTLLVDSVAGGIWMTPIAINASIDSLGLVTGLNVGTQVVYYYVYNTFTDPVEYHCFSSVSDTVHVIEPAVVGPINGTDTLCSGSTFVFTDDTLGGVWVSLTPDLASVDIDGTVTGLIYGTAVVGYNVTNVCGTTQATDTFVVYDPAPPITGALSLCVGITETLHNASTGGEWSIEDPSIAIVNSTSGAITGIHTGTTIVTYTATNFCGVFTVTANVYVVGNVYLTASSIVACQTLPGDTSSQEYVISGYSECIDVCEHSIIRYFIHGSYGAACSWTVTGGTIVNDYHDSIDVEWAGAGFIGSVSASVPLNSCMPSATACIRIIERPHASFTMSDTVICSNGTVYFSDGSTADADHPITSWNWDFGDGTHAVIPNPAHSYDGDGYFTVTLTVRNSCNCTDTQQLIIHVLPDKGPSIVCPSVACNGETLTYYTDDECDEYNWTVEGGTIISGSGTHKITVIWDAVGPDGYGYVNLNEPCMPCETSNTIRIPIIPINAPITGPSTVCQGESYMYSFPLIGGTQYQWGVLGHPEAIVSYRDDHTVVVNFNVAGSYTLHGWYQNRLKLCGGDVIKKISVVGPALIEGSRKVCLNDTITYSIPGGILEGDWALADITGTIIASGYGNSIGYTFTTAGSYQLSVSGTFCADPINITVSNVPAVVDSITGADTVCLNRPYMYVAHGTAGNAYIRWQATGGQVVPISGSDTVTVVWTGSGPKQLAASMTSTAAPYCTGPVFVYDITQEGIALELTGDTLPCANSYRDYNASYNRGEVYDWSIIPDTLGSVVAGLHAADMRVQWNNISAPRTASIALTVRKCDSVFYDTLIVHIQPNVPALEVSDSVCPGEPVLLTATAGGSGYQWHFGDGSSTATTSNTTSHVYGHSPSVSGQTFVATAAVIADPLAVCPVAGTLLHTVYILPEPYARAYSAESSLCDSPMLLTASVGTGAGAATIQWFDHNLPISGATGTTYTTTDTGTYMFVAIGANGCFDTSNIIHLLTNCDTGSGGDGPVPCDTGSAFCGITCNRVYLWCDSVEPRCCQLWIMHSPDGSTDTIATGVNNTYLVVSDIGSYTFEYIYTRLPDMCVITAVTYGTVNIVPSFSYTVLCGIDGLDSVILSDNSRYLSAVSPTGYDWSISPISPTSWTPFGSGQPFGFSVPGNSYYVIQEEVHLGPGWSCHVQAPIATPPVPAAVGFTATSSPICSGVPISFAPLDTVGIAGYYWDFGDSSSSLLRNTQRAYTNVGTGAANEIVTLRITDSIGCSADTTMIVTIQPNKIAGNMNPSEVICSTEAPMVLYYIPDGGSSIPISYLWNTGQTTPTISASISGSYFVTLSDVYQCQQTRPVTPIHLKFIKTPKAQIHGETHFCQGQTIRLNGDVGGDISYQWMKNGVLLPYYTPEIAMVLMPGDDTFRLIITATDSLTLISCSDTSAPFPVHIDSVLAIPVITSVLALDCSTYSIELTASADAPGTFNWSDGAFGPIDTINAGGQYKVWFTDTNGCVSSADTTVPNAPAIYMQYFPSGCYTICKELIPILLYGPPNQVFNYWNWQKSGDIPVDGYNSEMDEYYINGSGDYTWVLENSIFCHQESEPMSITTEECERCAAKFGEATAECSEDPAAYTINFSIDVGTSVYYTIGSNIGPMDPFSGTLPSGVSTLSYTFTTLELPPPSSMFMYIVLTNPDGTKCARRIKVGLPECEWIDEKPSDGSDTGRSTNSLLTVASAMMIYPNPASGQVNVNFDYGSCVYSDRSLIVYDNMGRTKYIQSQLDAHGSVAIGTGDWTPGMYIIRMTGDGKTLQTKRLIVSN